MTLKFDPENPAYEFVDTEVGLKKAFEDLSNEKVIAVDTECTDLDPYTSKLLLLQIAKEDKA